MTTELAILLYAVILAGVQLVLYAVPANRELGVPYTAGPRDAPPELSQRTARIKRAYENYLETLPWFAIAVIVAHLAGKTDAATTTAAWIYLAARILYIPAYIGGISYVRSAIWGVATGAIFFIVFRALF